MKLDDTAKIVTIVSGVVAAMISAAGFFANAKLQSLQNSINELKVADQAMDTSKKAYDLSARLAVEFSLPMARSFAVQYAESTSGDHKTRRMLMPPGDLSQEFSQVLVGWGDRRGLMTGKPCEQEGLAARQVVTLVVKNIGGADAENIVLKVKQKRSPYPNPATAWRETAAGGAWGGRDNLTAANGWTDVSIPIGSVRGLGSPVEDRTPVQVVLASVSGRTALFGTVLVPTEISWDDNVSKKRQSAPIMSARAAELQADLLGAEIGSLRSTCT
jgi:hypothetical protein